MSGSSKWTFRTVGAEALLVEVRDTAAAQAAYRLVRELSRQGRLRPPRDVVPGARTVLLDGLQDVGAWQRLLSTSELQRCDDGRAKPREPGHGPYGADVVVPVRYDGPDLALVASAWSCTEAEVVSRHVGVSFTVAFCGFAAGFAYCSSDPPLPVVPRHDHPREQVLAGSVALGGEYCGVYPRTLPGGWQLIGHTDLVVFDARRRPPALLQPGDVVRFEESR